MTYSVTLHTYHPSHRTYPQEVHMQCEAREEKKLLEAFRELDKGRQARVIALVETARTAQRAEDRRKGGG